MFEDLKEKTANITKNITNPVFCQQNTNYTLELEFVDRKKADIAEFLPCIKRVSDTSIVYESSNYEEVYKLLQFMTATLSN